MFQKIAPILKDYGGVDMQGEIDGAWNGMAERFATNAKGKVDVILGAAPAGDAAVAAGATGAGASPGAAGAAGIATGGLSGGLNIIDAGESAQGAGPPPRGGAARRERDVYGRRRPADHTRGSAWRCRTGFPTAWRTPPISRSTSRSSAGCRRQARSTSSQRTCPPTRHDRLSSSVGCQRRARSTSRRRTCPRTRRDRSCRSAECRRQARSTSPQRTCRRTRPRSVVPQAGMPSPGALNVTAVDMPPDTPRPADVQQAGRTAVAGQLRSRSSSSATRAITEVQLQQVASTPKGGALKSLGSLARDALLQKLQGFGSGN